MTAKRRPRRSPSARPLTSHGDSDAEDAPTNRNTADVTSAGVSVLAAAAAAAARNADHRRARSPAPIRTPGPGAGRGHVHINGNGLVNGPSSSDDDQLTPDTTPDPSPTLSLHPFETRGMTSFAPTQSCRRRVSHLRLVHRHHLDTPTVNSKHLMENQFVLSNYRANYTISEAAHSVFAVHSETMNVWTHGLAFVANLYIVLGMMFGPVPPHQTRTGHTLLLVQAILYCNTFLVSAMAHTFAATSPKVFFTLFKMDRLCIALLIAGAAASGSYFALRCSTTGVQSVAVALSALVGVTTAILGWRPAGEAKMRVLMTLLFVGEVVLTAVPLFLEKSALARACGPGGTLPPSDARCMEASGTVDVIEWWCYAGWCLAILGAIFHVGNFPERIAPGKFDFFPGHCVQHVLTASAAWAFQVGTITASTLTTELCDASGSHMSVPEWLTVLL